jgi:hypothetical protein
MQVRSFDMPRATKYIVPGLMASISLYIYMIYTFEETTKVYGIIKGYGTALIISGSIILGFIIASFENKYYKMLGVFYKIIHKKSHPYKLGGRIKKVIEELRSKGVIIELSDDELKGEKIRSNFWMWLVEQKTYPEIIFRQSLGSMYLFISWIFLIDIFLVVTPLLLPDISLLTRVFLVSILIVFGVSSYTTGRHYNERFLDYYIYYFEKFCLKEFKETIRKEDHKLSSSPGPS